MTRRRLYALVAVSTLAIAACGGDDDEPVTGATGEATEATEAATPDDGDALGLPDLSGQSVEVAAVWTGTEQERFEAVLSGFEERTGATVNYTSFQDEPGAFLGTRLQGGDPPDVALIAQPGLIQDFVDQGSLQPLDSAQDVISENFAQVWQDLGTFNDTLYALVFKAANKSTFWYNTEILEQAGVEPPGGWDELQSPAAETLAAFGTTPFSIGGADGWTLTDWFENVYLSQAGPDMYDQLANHEIPWTDESVTTALETLAEIWGNDDWIAGDALQIGFNDSVTQVFKTDPDAAMVYEGDFVAGVISADTETVVGEGADFFPFPPVAGGDPAVVSAGDMAVLFKDSDGGQAMIRWLASPEAAELWASEGGFISPNQGLDLSVYPDEIQQRLAEQLVGAESVRFDMSDLQPGEFGATAGQGLWGILQDFLADPSQVEQTAQQLEQAASRAFGG